MLVVARVGILEPVEAAGVLVQMVAQVRAVAAVAVVVPALVMAVTAAVESVFLAKEVTAQQGYITAVEAVKQVAAAVPVAHVVRW